MTIVNSWNEWDPLKHVIVGTVENSNVPPMEPALEKVFKLLKKGGTFYCGTDFYSDNTLTTRWIKDMNIPMDLRSEKEWKKMFREVGFTTRSKHVTDPKNKSKWKREFGTLFVIGRKS